MSPSKAATKVTVSDVAAGTSPPDETVWERRMRALTLRNAGMTYQAIADKLGVSSGLVRRDIRMALREVVSETAEDMLARQRGILFDLQRQAYPAALNGDRDAQAMILKTLDHEAKLFGLYAPTRVAVGVSDTEFAEQAAELISSLGLEPPKELRRAAHEPDTIDAEVVAPAGDSCDEPGGDGEPQPAQRPRPARPGNWSNI